MDVFAFRKELISEYERFSRSFVSIRAADIRQVVDEAYDSGRFWPAPLIQLNPNFVPGGSIEEFVANGILDTECAKIFRIKNPTDSLDRPPDILLTNYVMLELPMTRFVETDKAVRQHAAGLRFLVLDELHTYRGRQGAHTHSLNLAKRANYCGDAP